MIKTFIFGCILGVAASGAVLYYVPPVDLVREQSIVSVLPNGGNAELFHANLPTDRILVGPPGEENTVPAGLEWPRHEMFRGTQVELFKIRNAKDAVVGVASRIAANTEDGDLIEWVLHLPARGSVYLNMQPAATADGQRSGYLRAGTRDFATLTGRATEHWVADDSGAEDAPLGRIELRAYFVAKELEAS